MMLDIPLAASLRRASVLNSSCEEWYEPVTQVRLHRADEQRRGRLWPLEHSRCGLNFDRVPNSGAGAMAFDIVRFIITEAGLRVRLPDDGFLTIGTRKSDAVCPPVAMYHISLMFTWAVYSGENTYLFTAVPRMTARTGSPSRIASLRRLTIKAPMPSALPYPSADESNV